MSYFHQFLGGSVGLGETLLLPVDTPGDLIVTNTGKEFLRSGSLVAYAAKYAPVVAAAPWLRAKGSVGTGLYHSSASAVISTVAETSGGTVVIGSTSSGTFASSTNYGTWTNRSLTSGNGRNVAIANGGSTFVGTSYSTNRTIDTSTDGSTWTNRHSVSGLSANLTAPAAAYASTLGLWVAILDYDWPTNPVSGSVATRAAADPGGAWTNRTPTQTTYRPMKLFASPTLFLATQETQGNVYSSTDGITWTERSVGMSNIDSLAWTGSKWIAAGQVSSGVGGIKESSDGLTWSTWSGGVLPFQYAVNVVLNVASNGSGSVVVTQVATNPSYNAAAYSSDHGATWTSFYPAVHGTVKWSGQKFVFGGGGGPAGMYPGVCSASVSQITATTPDYVGGPYMAISESSTYVGTQGFYRIL